MGKKSIMPEDEKVRLTREIQEYTKLVEMYTALTEQCLIAIENRQNLLLRIEE